MCIFSDKKVEVLCVSSVIGKLNAVCIFSDRKVEILCIFSDWEVEVLCVFSDRKVEVRCVSLMTGKLKCFRYLK